MTSPTDVSTASIRPAGPPDHAAVLALIAEYYAHDGLTFDEHGMAPGLAELLRTPELGRVLLIEHQGQVAGYLIATFGFDLEFGGRLATVTDVYLRPAARRLHLGSAVFAALERLCLEAGVRALELQPERHNTAAQAFYRHLGFEVLDRVPMHKPLTAVHSSQEDSL